MSAVGAYLTVLFIFVAMSFVSANVSIVLGVQLTPVQLDKLAPITGGWAARVFFGLLVVWLGSRAVRTAGQSWVMQGLITGTGAAVALQFIFAVRYPPVELTEAALYLALGAACGPLGGFFGRLAAARERGFPRVREEIGTGENTRTIAPAIGENLKVTGVTAVALWHLSERPPGMVDYAVVGDGASGTHSRSLELVASWEARSGILPTESALEVGGSSALALSEGRVWVQTRGPQSPLARGRGPRGGCRDGGPRLRSVRQTLILPLTAPGGRLVGLLAVGFGLHYLFLSGRELRNYLDVAKQVALSLEARTAERLREREHIGREIHDTLAQGFTAIEMNLELAALDPVLDPRTQGLLARARLTAQTNLAEARRMIRGLEGRETLALSLNRLVDEWSAQTGVPAGVVVDGCMPAVPVREARAMTRVAQEALNNVHKHARATRVTLSLSHNGDVLVLDINDDGLGFDPPAADGSDSLRSGGFGVGSMRKRMENIGGTLVVESAPGAGTTIVAELPVRVEPDPTTGADGEGGA